MINEIALRPITDADFAALFALHLDEDATRMAAFGTRDPDAASLAARWKRVADTSTQRVVTLDGNVVGFAATYVRDGEPQVTYRIAREHWGRGLATRALSLLLEEVRDRPIFASAAADNAASIRVLTKCGFVQTGTARAFASARGHDIDEVFFVLR